MKDAPIIGYLLLAAVAFFIFTKMRDGYREGVNPDDHYMHCMTCGTDAIPVKQKKGTGLIEVILWLIFIVPGLLYSIWRRTGQKNECPQCHSTAVVPKQSPAAIKHRETLSS